MASCGHLSKFLQGWSIKSISNHVLPVWCKTLSFSKWYFIYPEFKGSWISCVWISYIAQQCSLFTSYFCIGIISLTYSCLSMINGIDVRCWNVFWPMNTADSREYRLLSSNITRLNMHKTNRRLQALLEGTNYLCNKKADSFLMWLWRLSIISCLT